MDTEYNKYNIQNYYQIHSITGKFLCNLPEELSILNGIEEPINIFNSENAWFRWCQI